MPSSRPQKQLPFRILRTETPPKHECVLPSLKDVDNFKLNDGAQIECISCGKVWQLWLAIGYEAQWTLMQEAPPFDELLPTTTVRIVK